MSDTVFDKKFTALQLQEIHDFKVLAEGLFRRLEIIEATGKNRCLSLAKTKIEEAVMWATKGIGRVNV